jgi:hypothetical protein
LTYARTWTLNPCFASTSFDALPSSLIDSNVSLRWK